MDPFEFLIVGAGFAGSVCAERLAAAGRSVLLIDQRAQVGGNAFDEYDDAGILVHRYGAHVFHTNSARVFTYLSRFTDWREYQHRVLAEVRGQLVPVPINHSTLEAFVGGDREAAARRAMYEPYTRKQWGEHTDSLARSVLARVQTRDNRDDRYFADEAFQCMPLHGYTRLFARLLEHPRIKVLLKTSYREVLGWLAAAEGRNAWGFTPPTVIYTGPIDEFFDHRFGRLPYRSASFEFATLDCEQALPVGVVNCPGVEHAFTRIAEFKHLTGQQHPRTTIAFEYPSATGEPFWPVPTAASGALYRRYEALAEQTPGVHFLGRLGSFKYYDMHQVVAQALTLSAHLLAHKEAVQ